MRLQVNVTDRDIMSGSCGEKNTCAVALAANRALSNHSRIHHCDVLPRTIRFYDAGNRLVCCRKLPKKVRTFVQVFDMGYSVRPFSFGVNLP